MKDGNGNLNWYEVGATVGSKVDSVLQGENAYVIENNGTHGERVKTDADAFSGGPETVYAIFEVDTSDRVELRVKESDRIAVMAEGLERLGVATESGADSLTIEGGPISGASVASHGDHRIAMSFALAALAATGPIRVTDCAPVATSFPGFAALARSVGLDIVEGSDDGI